MNDSLRSWVGRPEQHSKAHKDLIDYQKVSVYVFRPGTTAGNVGFSSELKGPDFLKKITARIDLINDQSQTKSYVGLTEDMDVRKEDRWVITGPDGVERRYRVSDIMNKTQTSVAARLVDDA